jgi:hypothetical protein
VAAARERPRPPPPHPRRQAAGKRWAQASTVGLAGVVELRGSADCDEYFHASLERMVVGFLCRSVPPFYKHSRFSYVFDLGLWRPIPVGE